MTLDERDPIVMADTGPLIRLAAAGLLDELRATNRPVVIVDRVEAEATQDRSKPFAKEIAEDVPFALQATRIPLTLMTTRRFARQLVEWEINVDAVAAIEKVAKTFTTKPSMSGEIDPDESPDFRRLPQADNGS